MSKRGAGGVKKQIFGFRATVSVALVGAMLAVLGLSGFLTYRASSDAQLAQLRKQLMTVAQTASLLVDGDALLRIPDGPEGAKSPDYLQTAERLRKVRELNPSIRFVYTLRQTGQFGILKFIVDLDPVSYEAGRRTYTAYPGDVYDATRFSEMLRGFEGPSADRSLLEDAWGVTLSGYAPVRDAAGRVVAVLGVDMDAGDVRLAQKRIARDALKVLGIGVLLAIAIGAALSRGITGRVTRLIHGTRRISAEDLSHRVEVRGRDEIAELSTSFNAMADALAASRQQLENHFCNVIEALIRMLETKDKYTQGHSERVGVYAKKIALQMGLPEADAELLRRAGELHDIGKLAVHDHVLNKVDPLTDEEWEMIRKHPVTGYETLKHIGLHEIILSSIHLHHERPDGTGYPKRLDGDRMGVYAQIVAVADAYDAMTTTRSYRKPVDRIAAVEELRRHAGTQFNPAVVEAFADVLAQRSA